MTNLTLWWIALIASAIAIVVVAVLLGLVVAATRSVDRHTAAMRATGEVIAGNTEPIRMLAQANDGLREIRAALEQLEQAARHLDGTIASLGREGS